MSVYQQVIIAQSVVTLCAVISIYFMTKFEKDWYLAYIILVLVIFDIVLFLSV